MVTDQWSGFAGETAKKRVIISLEFFSSSILINITKVKKAIKLSTSDEPGDGAGARAGPGVSESPYFCPVFPERVKPRSRSERGSGESEPGLPVRV